MTLADLAEVAWTVRPYSGLVFLLCGAGFYFWAIQQGKSRLRDIDRRRARLESLAQVEASLFRAMEARRDEAFRALHAVAAYWSNNPGMPGLEVVTTANEAGLRLSEAAQAWRMHLEAAYGVPTDTPAQTDAAEAPVAPASLDLVAEADPVDVPEAER